MNDAVMATVGDYEQGIGFEDAVNLISARYCTRFRTFDRTFVRRAARLKLSPACVEPEA